MPASATDRPAPGRVLRVLAAAYCGVVLVAVLWPSGADVSAFKDGVGPWFLTPAGKDVALNLVMLAPLTLLAALGWPRVPWWAWALAGCAVGLVAELTQWALPVLGRRPELANVIENGVGAWAGATLALALRAYTTRGSRRRGRRA
ncbi:VanZ family protein [Actinomyces ruminicola]|uniref:VanZ like family protein n=1 Tax=Actinomyces ruminicola TaxID=332524 RepID=A0A1G9Z1N7_9ACTO|nr:VanZ family protein [Actinomyces ruminicola]SDN15204.1 VanZ like family protein [Actinomyces ruminicola]